MALYLGETLLAKGHQSLDTSNKGWTKQTRLSVFVPLSCGKTNCKWVIDAMLIHHLQFVYHHLLCSFYKPTHRHTHSTTHSVTSSGLFIHKRKHADSYQDKHVLIPAHICSYTVDLCHTQAYTLSSLSRTQHPSVHLRLSFFYVQRTRTRVFPWGFGSHVIMFSELQRSAS